MICVRWYLRHSLSFREVEELLTGRGWRPTARDLTLGPPLWSQTGTAAAHHLKPSNKSRWWMRPSSPSSVAALSYALAYH
jgi:hypothetical protein